jgi:hypothetical protein
VTPRVTARFLFIVVALMGGRAWADSDSITLSVNLIVNTQEATSIGRATYQPSTMLCIDGCSMSGLHQISGGSATATWQGLTSNSPYEQELSNPANTGDCYRGRIEGWGSNGFHGVVETIEKCTPCVLWLETSGSGSVSGASTGQSIYNCGASVSLAATPVSGWRFVGWSGSIAGSSNTITFALDGSKSVTATFEQTPPDTPLDGGPRTLNNPTCGDPGQCSPILLNFGTGTYSLTSVDDGVVFDLGGAGAVRTAWTARGTAMGFLALDRDGNGRIDTGRELFGNATRLRDGTFAPNGFIALAEFDENHDGVIDAMDPSWRVLSVWIDANHNGWSEPSELQTLAASGAEAIALDHHFTGRTDGYGNSFRYQSIVTIGGRRGPLYDVWFVTAPR